MGTKTRPEATITITLFIDGDDEPGGMVQIERHNHAYTPLMVIHWALTILVKYMAVAIVDV